LNREQTADLAKAQAGSSRVPFAGRLRGARRGGRLSVGGDGQPCQPANARRSGIAVRQDRFGLDGVPARRSDRGRPHGQERLGGAHAAAGTCLWELAGGPGASEDRRGCHGAHSEKDRAAGNFKGGSGFHPILAYANETSEALAGARADRPRSHRLDPAPASNRRTRQSEPKRPRYRILHLAARLSFHARTATLRIQANWPGHWQSSDPDI
jgi:hypothetical protein